MYQFPAEEEHVDLHEKRDEGTEWTLELGNAPTDAAERLIKEDAGQDAFGKMSGRREGDAAAPLRADEEKPHQEDRANQHHRGAVLAKEPHQIDEARSDQQSQHRLKSPMRGDPAAVDEVECRNGRRR